MTITEAVADTYLKATGKVATLTSGTKFNKIVGLLNFYQRRWAREPNVDWASLYTEALSLGTVTATDTFDIDTSSIKSLSKKEGDVVRIVHSDGVGYTDYDIIPHDELKEKYYGPNKESSTGFYCARVGNQLVFNHEFVSTDTQFGGEIFVPCYSFPDAIVSSAMSDEVQVDDPDWLVLRAAAEYVRTDLTRQGQYSNLLQEANEAMQRMIDDNEGQIDEVSRPWTPFSGIGNDSAWS